MKNRTTQDLLAERRAIVLESMRAVDATSKAMLAANVAEIDAELARRNVTPTVGIHVTRATDIVCPTCDAAPGAECTSKLLPHSPGGLHRERVAEACRITRDANKLARATADVRTEDDTP